MVKVLFVLPLAQYMVAHWTDRILAARAAGYNVHLAVPDDGTSLPVSLATLPRYAIAGHRGRLNVIAELRYVISVYRVVRQIRPDIMHAVTIRPVIYGGIVRRILGINHAVFSLTGLGFVFMTSGTTAKASRKMVEAAYRWVFLPKQTIIVFENADDRDLLVEGAIVSERSTRVFIGGGVDMGEFSWVAPPQTAEPLVVLIGRMLADKGIREFADAARSLHRLGSAGRFVLVGDVDEGNPTSLSAEELRVYEADGSVQWWGWRDDIAEIIADASIVCLPSYREGAPRTLIEAAAIGRPAVATDVPGCRDVVVNGVTGLLVPVADSAALAEALESLIADSAVRSRMGLAARSHAEANFSSNLAAKRLLGVYAELLASG